jgi:hypothetical protein
MPRRFAFLQHQSFAGMFSEYLDAGCDINELGEIVS